MLASCCGNQPCLEQIEFGGLCCKAWSKASEGGYDRRVGWSSRFELEPLVEKLRCLGQGERPEAEGSLDDAGLAANVAGEIEGQGLPRKERAHHLETLDRRIGRLERLEPPDRLDQLLQLAVTGLDDVVQIFD
jgi:hypothetical protein